MTWFLVGCGAYLGAYAECKLASFVITALCVSRFETK